MGLHHLNVKLDLKRKSHSVIQYAKTDTMVLDHIAIRIALIIFMNKGSSVGSQMKPTGEARAIGIKAIAREMAIPVRNMVHFITQSVSKVFTTKVAVYVHLIALMGCMIGEYLVASKLMGVVMENTLLAQITRIWMHFYAIHNVKMAITELVQSVGENVLQARLHVELCVLMRMKKAALTILWDRLAKHYRLFNSSSLANLKMALSTLRTLSKILSFQIVRILIQTFSISGVQRQLSETVNLKVFS